MMFKRISVFLLAAVLLGGLSALAAQEAPWIRVKADRVAPRSQIVVEYKIPFGYAANAWIGFIPTEVPHGSEAVNDEYDVCYEYLGKTISGSVTLPVPDLEGPWDLRLHDTDDSGLEVASLTVMVSYDLSGARPLASYGSSGAAPGTKAPAQTVPAAEPAAASADDSLLRQMDEQNGITLLLDKTVFAPGEAFGLAMTSSRKMAKSNLFVVLPHDIPAAADMAYLKRTSMYTLSGAVKGTFSLVAPGQPGLYDIRLYDNSTKGLPLALVTIRVE